MTSGRAMWTAFSADPRDPGAADLKASDADRDLAGEVLREAYADGRLTRAEYDERSAAVLAARTIGAFSPLLVDLVRSTASPVVSTTADLRDKAVQRYRRDLADARNGWVFVSVVTLSIWTVTCLLSGELLHFWPIYPSLGVGLGYVSMRFSAEARIEKHEEKIAETRRVRRQRRRDLED
ncbi:DUF1707 domain-containing protein [Aeromicrobium sp. NPDC092404]|uniref:DUF1707 SHOCT-like domain-containing protein n=1 Tax=Aeromicrobium sp. NPDC092404 TaxID=3154976 RepID=UPI003445640F